jgi:3-mercaptopyruvate sulfurtransferase SseA
MGYTAVHSVEGGWRAWEAAGAPTEGPEPVARVRVSDVGAVLAALRAAGATVETVGASGAAQAVRVRADDGNVVELWQGMEPEA